ncbi:MAG: rod shape-determining protein RodA [Bacillota bacterium]
MFLHWEKKYFKNINLAVPLITLVLILLGLAILSSAVELNLSEGVGLDFIQRQVMAIILGLVVIIGIQFFDYRQLKHYYLVIYLFTIGLLVYILLSAGQISGARRWLKLGSLQFQPSELAKILLIISLAAILNNREKELKQIRGIAKMFGYLAVPFVLIVLQNDLGTAMVLLVIFMVMLYVAGGNNRIMLILIGGGLLCLGIVIFLHIFFEVPVPFMHDYQVNRLLVFINPSVDPQGSGYNITQSLIAVGSGRLTGKGWFNGTQNQLDFLPEKHTDFIFSVFGEEFGFLGVSILLVLYFSLLWQFLNIALETKNSFGKLIVSGIAAMLFFHVFENVGMTMGLMPITGLPLPFLSYGGSSMLSFLLGIGLVININLKKKKLSF